MPQINAKSGLAKINVNGRPLTGTHKFQVTQSPQGASLLFAIGEDQHLHCIRENQNGQSPWASTNLTEAHSDLQRVIDFAQHETDQAVHLVAAMEVDGQHGIYTLTQSWQESEQDRATNWNRIDYDDDESRFDQLTIKQVNLRCIDDEQVISVLVADQKRTFRYYVNPNPDFESGEKYWNPRQFALDFDAQASLRQCMGVNTEDNVTGIYSLGKINGKPELLFTPLYDEFDASINPAAEHLDLGDLHPDAIASCFSDSENSELFLAAAGSLYYYAGDQQTGSDQSPPTKLFDHPLFEGVQGLDILFEAGHYIVWGHNQRDEIFYVTCPAKNLHQPTAWSNPVVIRRDVKKLSSFYNRSTRELTYFSQDQYDRLTHSVRCPHTTLWTTSSVVIPHSDNETGTEKNGYKSTIFITDDSGVPHKDQLVHLKTKSGTTARVLLNKVTRTITENGLHFPTNADGVIELEEITDDLAATQFELTLAGEDNSVSINPMDYTMSKLQQLRSADDLTNMGLGQKSSSEEKDQTAAAIRQVTDAYFDVQKNSHEVKTRLRSPFTTPGQSLLITGPGQVTAVALDLDAGVFDWVSEGIEKVVSSVGDVIDHAKEWIKEGLDAVVTFAKGAWRLITKIGNAIFHAVLDSAKAALGAVTNILKKVADTAEDLWDKLMSVSKGVDVYVYCADDTTAQVSIAGNNRHYTTGQHQYSSEIAVRDLLNNTIEIEAFGKRLSGRVDPITGTLFSADFSHLLATPTLFIDDQVISYGFYDAGPGLVGLPRRDQVYVYTGKKQSNWMGDLLKAYPNTKITIDDLVLPASHDSGMCVDISLEADLTARSLIIGAGALAATILPTPIIAPLLSAITTAAGLIYSPTRISRNAAVTQKGSIKEQLKVGSRYFDFRPGYDLINSPDLTLAQLLFHYKSDFAQFLLNPTVPGLVTLGGKLKERLATVDFSKSRVCHLHAVIPGVELAIAVRDIVDFLNEHPNEIVILSLMDNGIELKDYLIPDYDILDKIVAKNLAHGIKKVTITSDDSGYAEKAKKIDATYKSWKAFSDTDVRQLIKENKRLIVAYDIERGSNKPYASYSSHTNCIADPDAMIHGTNYKVDGGGNNHSEGMGYYLDITKDGVLSSMAMQATLLEKMINSLTGKDNDHPKGAGFNKGKLAELLLAFASFSNASSFIMAPKARIDATVYPWLRKALVEEGRGKGTVTLSNDFVDIGMVSIAVEASHKRLSMKPKQSTTS